MSKYIHWHEHGKEPCGKPCFDVNDKWDALKLDGTPMTEFICETCGKPFDHSRELWSVRQNFLGRPEFAEEYKASLEAGHEFSSFKFPK